MYFWPHQEEFLSRMHASDVVDYDFYGHGRHMLKQEVLL